LTARRCPVSPLHGEQRREDAKGERAEDAVSERFALFAAREPQHEDREHQRVVGTEQSFEKDEQANRQKIGQVNIHQQWANLDASRIKVYIWIDAGTPAPSGVPETRR
jgi:hypothetical protein